jgi:allantoin racemase
MKICVINPVITRSWEQDTQEEYSKFARPTTQVRTVSLDWGPASVESRRDEAIAVPDIMHKAMQAEREGFDAVIIDCMADPGLLAVREAVRIPVVGPVEASMHLAVILGHRFSMISLMEADRAFFEDLVVLYGIDRKLASVRCIGVPVLDIHTNLDAVAKGMMEASEKAVREDGAHVLIPGCNLLACLVPRIQASLDERGLPAVFLNSREVVMKLAESLVDMRLSHSLLSYPPSEAKEITWPVKTAFST